VEWEGNASSIFKLRRETSHYYWEDLTLRLLSFLVVAAGLRASPIVWSLSGVAFSDGGTATGSFTFDADTSAYSAIDIQTAGGSIPGTLYLDTDTSLPALGAFIFIAFPVASPGLGTQEFLLQFSSALTDAGGVDPASFGAEGPCVSAACDGFTGLRNVTSGSVTAAPEPSSFALGLLGAAIVLAMRRSRLTSN
jgi:hypothetical protein